MQVATVRRLIVVLGASTGLIVSTAVGQQDAKPSTEQSQTEISPVETSAYFFSQVLLMGTASKHMDELREAIETTRKGLARRFEKDPAKYAEAHATLCFQLLEVSPGLGLEEYELLETENAGGEALNACRVIAAQKYLNDHRADPYRKTLRKIADDPAAPVDYAAFALVNSPPEKDGIDEWRKRLEGMFERVELAKGPRFAALFKTLVKATTGEERLFNEAIIDAYAAIKKSPDPRGYVQVDDLTWASGMLIRADKLDQALEAATAAEAVAKQLPANDPRVARSRIVRAQLLKATHADAELKAYADVDVYTRYESTLGIGARARPSGGFRPIVDVMVFADIRKAAAAPGDARGK